MFSVSSAPHYSLHWATGRKRSAGESAWLPPDNVISCGESWGAKLYLSYPNLTKICFALYFYSPQSQLVLYVQALNEELRLLKGSIYHRTLQVLFPWEGLGLVCVFLYLHSVWNLIWSTLVTVGTARRFLWKLSWEQVFFIDKTPYDSTGNEKS